MPPSPLIVIAGAPRSGTTWLAKIIDSHPDVLYRHEPDHGLPCPDAPSAAALLALIAQWRSDRSPRSAAKRPLFRKQYRHGWQALLRLALTTATGAASRLGAPDHILGRIVIPDLVARPPGCVAIKSIRFGASAVSVAETVPDSRTVFILRHPCGQVASVMRGAKLRRFDLNTEGTDMPFDEAATLRFAAAFGVSEPVFQALPEAARYAWSWRAFNEPACARLARCPNARIVVYETLCAQPAAEARAIFDFCGLDWARQTEMFVQRSTNPQHETGYYGVFHNAIKAAGSWRTGLSAADQAAIRLVLAESPLGAFWPDLVK